MQESTPITTATSKSEGRLKVDVVHGKNLNKSMVKQKKKSILKKILNKKGGKGKSPLKLDGGLGNKPLKNSDIGGGNGSNLGVNGIF